MAVYAGLDDVVGYLSQLRDADVDNPDLEVLEDCLSRAEAAVNAYIGVTTNLSLATAADRIVYGNGLQILPLPPFTADSVTEVVAPDSYTVPDYIEQDGCLVITDSTGIVVSPYRSGLSYTYGSTTVWQQGVPYTVSADFGYSATDLDNLVQATLERAVQYWRYKDSGGSETIGSEGAITTVKTGWTPGTKELLDGIAKRVRGFNGGVW